MFNINNNHRGSLRHQISTIIAGTMLAVTSAILPTSATVSSTAAQQNIDIQPDVVVAQINLNINPVSIGKAIDSAVKKARTRGAFVRSVMREAYYNGAKGKYNVMVFNLSQDYAENLKGIQYYDTVTFNNELYGVWIFESGEFINKGDGGWINWAFMGNFERDLKYVKFHKP